jgi:hypothetical protein
MCADQGRQKDRVIAEFPLTIGVIGTVLAPSSPPSEPLTAVMTECTIEVEKSCRRDKKSA